MPGQRHCEFSRDCDCLLVRKFLHMLGILLVVFGISFRVLPFPLLLLLVRFSLYKGLKHPCMFMSLTSWATTGNHLGCILGYISAMLFKVIIINIALALILFSYSCFAGNFVLFCRMLVSWMLLFKTLLE